MSWGRSKYVHRVGGGGAFHLGVAESMGNAPPPKKKKYFNFRIGPLFKTVTPEILAMPQSRNYSEVPVQRVCLYFFQNIHSLSILFLLIQNGGD